MLGTVEARARGLAARVDEVGTWVGGAVPTLASLGARRSSVRRGAAPTSTSRCTARALLEQREIPLAGAGFVAERGALHDVAYWLEWWTADPEVGAQSCRRLAPTPTSTRSPSPNR